MHTNTVTQIAGRIPLYVILAAVLVSCAGGPSVAPPPENSSPEITESEIAHHLSWLASDELEGRGSGTKANDIAAQYIAKEFARYGLTPAGKNGFFQPFEIVTEAQLGLKNSFAASFSGSEFKFELRKDYIPLAFSMSDSAQGEVVFVGYGITAPQQHHNDYAGVDLKGKIALAFSGYPDEDNPHSEYGMVASLRSKALFAREAGAAALLIVNPEKDELHKLKYDNAPANSGIIMVNIAVPVAEKLLATTGRTLKDWVSQLQEHKNQFKAQVVPGAVCSVTADVQLVRKPTSNVVGIVEGTEPTYKEYYLVVGAHYDHLGWGQEGTLYKGEVPMVHNGADDNASGTAGLLELAQYFSTHRPKHSMLFMAYSAEEMGTLGSMYWVQNPTVPLEKISAMFNMDMIGRMPDSTMKLTVQGSGTSPFWDRILKDINKEYSFDLATVPDGRGASDQASFYMKDIPVLFFFSGLHSDYHRPSDDFDKINIGNEKKILDYVTEAIERTDNEPGKLAFTKVKGAEATQMRSFSIYVGTIPDYGADVEGFRISGTSPGGPAEKAGMKAGDIIVQFGATKVKSIYDYMNALSFHKAGENVPVMIKRGEETITLTVTPTKK